MRERMSHKNGHAHARAHAHIRAHMPDISQIAEKVPSWDEVAQRYPMLERMREDIPEWGQVRERLTTPPATTGVAYSLIGTAAGLGAFMLYTRRRSLLAWAAPIGLMVFGMALLAGGFAHRRGTRIDETLAHMREELAALDPVARAKVISSVARDSAAPLIRRLQQL
jgi:hypothetical protein